MSLVARAALVTINAIGGIQRGVSSVHHGTIRQHLRVSEQTRAQPVRVRHRGCHPSTRVRNRTRLMSSNVPLYLPEADHL